MTRQQPGLPPARPGGRRVRGYVQAVAAASLWGTSGIFAVHLFRLGLPPESQALLRPLVGLVFLAILVGVRYPRAVAVDRTGLIVLLVGGGFAVGVFQLAYQLSTDAVGVPSTVAMLYLAPAVVMLGAGPLLGEWPNLIRILLLIITLSGVWISVLGAHDVPATFGSAGLGWGLLAGLSYGAYTLFGRFAAPRWGSR